MPIVILAGCRSSARTEPASPKPDPAAIYQQIHTDFLHGNLSQAEQKAEKARKEFSADAVWGMRYRLLEAEILTDRGRRTEVVALLHDPAVTYPTTGELAIKRDLLSGMAHAGLGQEQESETEFREAERLCETTHSRLRGEMLRAKATVELHRGHLAESVALSQQSLKVAREQRDAFLESSDLLNLGRAAIDTRRYDEALHLLSGAAEAARPIQARVILELALGNLGLAYLRLGDFEKALPNSLNAADEGKQIGTESLRVDWLWNAGFARYMLGNLEEAKAEYEEALKTAAAVHATREISDIEAELAFVLYRQGKLDEAKKHDALAIAAAGETGDSADELQARYLEALLSSRQGNQRDPERLLLQISRKAQSDPVIQGEIYGALGDFYARQQQPAKADMWYRKAVRSFEAQRAEIADEELRLPFFANGDALYRRYGDFLIDSHKPEAALELLDAGRARTLEEGLRQAKQMGSTGERPVDVMAVARKLDSVILFYSLGPERSWLWVIAPHRTKLVPLPGQATIQTQVQNYQNAILKSNDPLREENAAAQMLYDTLVEPALIPSGSRVVVIADGALNGLNFETLLVPGAAGQPSARFHYWIEDVTVSSANSIRMLSHADPAPVGQKNNKMLLIGNPASAGTGYDTLVNAFAEIRGIEKHFPADARTVVTQSEAVPGAYAAESPDAYSYIHFVAHGTASRLDPLDSAIVLSPSPQNPDNFKLYAREIMRCPLHARLVTISSCYGSGLRAYAGEGLVGLSWAFLRAGAHNVVGALWEVNDASTPLLMDRMYGAIQTGEAPDVALREAKLSLIHSQAVYRKPLYWGAFQLYAGS